MNMTSRSVAVLTIILGGALFLPSHVVPSTHAQFTGLVCITASTTATSCPANPPSLGPFTVGQTFTVGVFVQGSDAMGGFNIFVSVDRTYLNPISAALGTLIVTPTFTTICINGVSVSGTCDSAGSPNRPGVVQVETLENSGLNECGGVGPCSGMAFTITYQVMSMTPSTSLSYPTAPECSYSSVPGNVCVLVDAYPSDAILPQNLQGAIVTQTSTSTTVSKFFTDSSLNPLPLDINGNPKVDVILAKGIVESTNPGQVLAWVNVTNTGSTSLQSLKLNETLPVDWVVHPAWMPAKGAIHVYYANTSSLVTNPEITQPSTITVSTGNPETVFLAISNLTATSIGHPLLPGQSILLSVKLTYGLIKTSQSISSYPRNYGDTASAAAWTQPAYMGTEASANGSGFFIAYAKVVGDPNGPNDFHLILMSEYAIT